MCGLKSCGWTVGQEPGTAVKAEEAVCSGSNSICLFVFFFSRQDLTVSPWVSWSSLRRPGRLQSSQTSPYLYLPRAEIQGEARTVKF